VGYGNLVKVGIEGKIPETFDARITYDIFRRIVRQGKTLNLVKLGHNKNETT
jgi:hypothetical protein